MRGETWRQAKFRKLGESRATMAKAVLGLISSRLPNINESNYELALRALCSYWECEDSKKDRLNSRQAKRQACQFVDAVSRVMETWDAMPDKVQDALREKVMIESDNLELIDFIEDLPYLTSLLENPEEWLVVPDPRRDSGRIVLTRTMSTVWGNTTGKPASEGTGFSKMLHEIYKLIGVKKWADTVDREVKLDLHNRTPRLS